VVLIETVLNEPANGPNRREKMTHNRAFEGEVKIVERSSLRKLMRAARRDMIPPERMFIIQQAMEKSARLKK
jgi:hypothetical protein